MLKILTLSVETMREINENFNNSEKAFTDDRTGRALVGRIDGRIYRYFLAAQIVQTG